MRNLKKVLSLALALVMLVGMMVVGAGAASFKDDASIKNQEAVDVVSGLEVLLGDETGNFNPQGNLTRAQAATVIAKLDLGASFGSLAATNASSFSDVAANYWGKPYIDYCAARGLILGVGGGRYDPEASVTGVQFALMVCRVLGYEDANENITGANWETAAAALARKAGLTVNVALSSQPMTRDDMAQVAYNALQADMVEYDGRAISINGVYIPAGKAEAVKGGSGNDYRTSKGATNDTKQLCEEKFPNLVLDDDGSENDAFGRPANKWSYNKDVICTIPSEAAFTFTASTSASSIAKTLKGYQVQVGTTPAWVNIVNSGTANTFAYTKNGNPVTAADASADSSAKQIADLTGNGVLVELYATDSNNPKHITGINVVETALMQITRINANNKTVTLTEKSDTGIANSIAVDDEGAFYATLSDMDVDDYVLITASHESGSWVIQSVAEPETVTGAITKVTTGKKLTVDGTEYNLAKVLNTTPEVDSKTDVVVFLDAYDNVIHTTAAEAVTSKDVVYVTAVYTGTGTWGSTNLFQGVLPDGTTITGEYKAADGTTISGASQTGVVNKAYTYTMSGDTYVLANAAVSDGMGATALPGTIAAGAKKTGSYYFASDVKFVYVNGYKGDLVTSVKDGVQAVTAGANNYIVVAKDGLGNSVVTTVFVNGLASTSGDDLVYVAKATSSNGTDTGSDGSRLYTFPVYINGEEKTIVRDTSASIAKGFYTYSINDKSGAYTLKSTSSGVITGKKVTAVDHVNDAWYLTITSQVTESGYDAADAFVVDTRDNGTINDQDALKDAVADTGTYPSGVNVAIAYNSNDKVIVGVYVVDAPSGAKTVTVSNPVVDLKGAGTGTPAVKVKVDGTTIKVGLDPADKTAQNNDTITFKVTAAAGATITNVAEKVVVASDGTATVTVKHNGTNWTTAGATQVKVTAENGDSETYTISVLDNRTGLDDVTTVTCTKDGSTAVTVGKEATVTITAPTSSANGRVVVAEPATGSEFATNGTIIFAVSATGTNAAMKDTESTPSAFNGQFTLTKGASGWTLTTGKATFTVTSEYGETVTYELVLPQ